MQTVRRVLGRRVSVEEMLEILMWLAIPYLVIGLGWAFFHPEQVAAIERAMVTPGSRGCEPGGVRRGNHAVAAAAVHRRYLRDGVRRPQAAGLWLPVVRRCAVLMAAVAALAGCSSVTVVNTGDAPPQNPTSTSTAVPQYDTAHLVDGSAYATQVDGRTGYYFSTPSGRWRCAILPRDKAGCQSASGLSAIAVPGAPTGVPDGSGGTTTPNAIAVDRDHDAAFIALTEPEFSVADAKALPFGKVLAVAGFRCNVQESSGVSCVRELTGKGFTFSGDNFTQTYTDVP
jgi:hypothetical protein